MFSVPLQCKEIFDQQLLEHKRKLPVKSPCIIFMTLRIPIYPPNPMQPVAFTQTSDLSPDLGLFTMWEALLKIFQEGKPLLIHGFIHSL